MSINNKNKGNSRGNSLRAVLAAATLALSLTACKGEAFQQALGQFEGGEPTAEAEEEVGACAIKVGDYVYPEGSDGEPVYVETLHGVTTLLFSIDMDRQTEREKAIGAGDITVVGVDGAVRVVEAGDNLLIASEVVVWDNIMKRVCLSGGGDFES
jgi:hypothetical protein